MRCGSITISPPCSLLRHWLLVGCLAAWQWGPAGIESSLVWAGDRAAEAEAADAADEDAAEDAAEPDLEVPDDAPPAEEPAEPGENPGQEDLDAAINTRITATTLDDLGRAILLCETALLKGLDRDNTAFAKQLLASTRLERAGKVSSLIFDQTPPNPQWPQLRRIALSDLEKAVEVQPELAEAHLLVARLQALPGGDEEQAREAANLAVRHADPEDRRFRSRALMVRGDLADDEQQQLADYDAALQLFPSNVDALRSRGLHHMTNDRFEQAEQDFEAARLLEPEDPRTLEVLGVVLFMQDKLDEALVRLDETIEQAPDSPLAFTYRARVYALQEKYDEAVADANRALALAPEAVSLLMLRAQIHSRAGNHDRALTDAESLLELQPDLSEAIQLKAVLLAADERTEEAIDFLKRQSEQRPDDADLLVQLAMLYMSDKQHQLAIETYDAVLEKQEDHVSALRSRGDAHLNIGREAQAVADYERVIELDPSHHGALNNLAWVLATSIDEELRDGARAVELAERAGEVTNHREAYILSTMAAAYAETGDFERAVEWAAKAVEIGEGDVLTQLKAELECFRAGKPWREVNHPDGTRSSGPEGDLQREEE